MAGTRAWGRDDRTGGPLDQLLDRVGAEVPWLVVARLHPTYPADDDNVYWLGDGGQQWDLVQVDTRPGGQLPFIVEGSRRIDTSDPEEAAATVVRWLLESQQ